MAMGEAPRLGRGGGGYTMWYRVEVGGWLVVVAMVVMVIVLAS
jgi:hypothetical protein